MKTRKSQKVDVQKRINPAAASSDPLNRETGKPIASVQQEHELK